MITPACHPTRKHYAFGQCEACYMRNNRHRFPSQSSEVKRARYSPAKNRQTKLEKDFGLTPGAYDEMLDAQGGVCAICSGPPGGRWSRFCVDHDHDTGRIRGLLCVRCNRVLGLLKDNPAIAAAAAAYLIAPDAGSWRKR